MQNVFSSKIVLLLGLVGIAGIAIVATLFGVFTQAQVQKFLFVEDNKVYLSSISSASVEVGIGSNVEGMLDYNASAGKYLYRIAESSAGNHNSGTLVFADSNTGNANIVKKGIITAALSPEGTQVVVWDENNEIHLVTIDGKEIARIGVHGSLPVFSQDGAYIAYNKLADEGEWFFDLSRNSPYGIALYNLKTNKEEIITDNTNDFQPLGFSADMSKLYFNSGRTYDTTPKMFSNHVASLWIVDLKTKEVTRLTNIDEQAVRRGDMVPIIHSTALWTSDRKKVISSLEEESGVWQFTFSDDGGLVNAERVADGTSPRWIVPDTSIAVRATVGNKSEWRIINVK